MEIPSQEGHDIAIPLSSTYGGHMMHHPHHHDPPLVPHHHHHHHQQQHHHHSIIPQIPPSSTINGSSMENIDHESAGGGGGGPAGGGLSGKKSSSGHVMRYRECLKNHAAGMGGNATDGCGEFMPSGEEGSIEALTCSACSCHRNFHRKESGTDHQPGGGGGDHNNNFIFPYHHDNPAGHLRVGRKLFLGYPTATGTLIRPSPAAVVPHHQQMIMSYNMPAAAAGSHSLPSDQSDDQEDMGGMVVARPPHHHQMGKKKRFRTKFTAEQKEKMLGFAEKVGWKIQKQEESVVQQFCQEIGVKRRVLKVWMHNNKHNLAKKNNNLNNNNINNPSHDHLLVSAAPNINSSTTN